MGEAEGGERQERGRGENGVGVEGE
jgi:hypothetical protein